MMSLRIKQPAVFMGYYSMRRSDSVFCSLADVQTIPATKCLDDLNLVLAKIR